MPGSETLGLLGVLALGVAVSLWLAFILFAWSEGKRVDPQGHFLRAAWRGQVGARNRGCFRP